MHILRVKNSNVLVVSDADGEGKAGSVAHELSFVRKDKKTGSEVHSSAVNLVTVSSVDGKKMVTELTEVTS